MSKKNNQPKFKYGIQVSGGVEKGKVNTGIKKHDEQIQKGLEQKEKRIREYRKEASRLSAMANKRLQRLEKSGMKNTPAYRKWIDEGGEKFSVRGKTFNEVQQETARLRRFLNSETSTIRGANNVLKEMAKNTGIKYSNLTELREKSDKFFELSSKVEQYLRTVEDMASAIGYQKIWQAINEYVKDEKIDLSQTEHDIDKMTEKIVKALKVYDEKESLKLNGEIIKVDGWYKLSKD